MQLAPITARTAAAPVPVDPRVVATARQMLAEARDAVQQAIVSTTATDRIDPSLPFWSFRAIDAIGRAAGLMQAVDGYQKLSRVLVPVTVYVDNLGRARRLIVDAASDRQAGRPVDPAAFVAANAALRSLLHQFAFDITKHDRALEPAPPAAAPRP